MVEADPLALNTAWQAWREGRRRRARELAEALLPTTPAARLLLARLSLDAGDMATAQAWLEPLPPQPAQAQIQAQLWLELNQPQQGLACLDSFPAIASRETLVLRFCLQEAQHAGTPPLDVWPPGLSQAERIALLLNCLPHSRYPEALSAWLEEQKGPASWRCQLLHQLAQAWLQRGQPTEAQIRYRQALRLGENPAESLWGLGVCAQESGARDAAENYYHQSLKLQPGLIGAHFNLGVLLLSRGDWKRGFQELEWRLQKRARQAHPPRWQGQSLQGKTLLIEAEYGLGDQIQFWRFLPALYPSAAQVLLEVPPALYALASRLDLPLNLLRQGYPPTEAVDYTLPLLSLPHRLNINSTDEIRRLPPWRPQFCSSPQTAQMQISLVWQGRQAPARPAYQHLQRRKALPAPYLSPLLQSFPQIQWWGLQPDLESAAFPAGLREPPVALDQLAATADWLQSQMLLIGIDSAVIHLAGSLGLPAWLLLAEPAPWIWPESGSETPWYPHLRIFRQPHCGDWQGLVQTLSTALSAALCT